FHDNTTPVTRDPVRNSDPMLWVDPVTDRVFAPFMFPTLACSEGVWSDRPMACGLPGIDHQKLATGGYTKDNGLLMLPPVLGSDYPNVVYFCYNDIKSQEEGNGPSTRCAMSTDGGSTYPTDNEVANAGQCGGINGHPAAAPNGTVFVPLGLDCGQPTVARSFAARTRSPRSAGPSVSARRT
ncbi:MAG: hypothetical protein LC624_07440, partial [Halobacteriales archaeon]|nr:hypothetical protein [Halobacteriales archaeon]